MEQRLETTDSVANKDPGLMDLLVRSISDSAYLSGEGDDRLAVQLAGQGVQLRSGGLLPAEGDGRLAVQPDAGATLATADGIDVLPPYASYSSWVRLLDALSGSLPRLVDESYLASLKLSESSIKPLRSALRFLGLVARDGRPTEKLERLVEALHEGGTAKVGALREIVQQSYSPLFSADFNLKSAATDELRLYFATMGARGQIQQKCSSFFLNLARDAGLELPPQLISRAPLALGRQRAATGRTRTGEFQISAPITEHQQPVFSFPRQAGFLRDIFPTFDIDWPEEKKQRWFRDFARVVKICEREGETLVS